MPPQPATNRYDDEGNVIAHWRLKTTATLTGEVVQNTSAVVAVTTPQTAIGLQGWYRLRFAPVTLDSATPLGFVTVTYGLYEEICTKRFDLSPGQAMVGRVDRRRGGGPVKRASARAEHALSR